MAGVRMESVHTNAAIANVLVGYKNPEYVLGDVFPFVPVNFETGTYYKWDQGSIFRDEAEVVGPRGRTPRIGFGVTAETYSAKEYALAGELPVRIRENMDPAIAAEANVGKQIMDKILLKRERVLAALLSTASYWGTTASAAGNEWDAVGGGTPDTHVETALVAVRGKIGIAPNTMVVTWRGARALRKNTVLLNYVKSGANPNNPAIITIELLRQMFDIPNIIVVGGMYDSANEGQTSVLADILGDSVWIGYVAPSPGLMEPSAGYTFVRKQPNVRTWSEDDPEQDVVRVGLTMDPKITMSAAGYVLTNTLMGI